ncbi:hypothetical protein JTE90_003655 [Oedothorax gibbosus]|uniref:Uncharacterized protein n=1 Tax=Oedothorax gibbosus TaxID=931172 RepID=A0AAV6VQV5_9ARAC|nr:hypothetical protein JTE90_003655 [Oedothorax gibbosus]
MNLSKISDFDPEVDDVDTYILRIKHFLSANGIGEDLKVLTLITILGTKAVSTLIDLFSPEDLDSKTYNEIIEKFKSHYKPAELTIDALRDRLISGVAELRQKLISEELTFQQACEQVRKFEEAKQKFSFGQTSAAVPNVNAMNKAKIKKKQVQRSVSREVQYSCTRSIPELKREPLIGDKVSLTTYQGDPLDVLGKIEVNVQDQVESAPLTAKEIAVATQEDPVLRQVLHFTFNGWPEKYAARNHQEIPSRDVLGQEVAHPAVPDSVQHGGKCRIHGPAVAASLFHSRRDYVRSVRGEKVKWFPGRIIHRRTEVTFDVQVCGQLRFCHADHIRRNPATDEVWTHPEVDPPIPERPPGSAATPVSSSRGPPEPVDAPNDPPRMPPLEIKGTHRSESPVLKPRKQPSPVTQSDAAGASPVGPQTFHACQTTA